jgi:nicotinate-nucleotide pyrophosphorylase (carboxylating)
VTGALADLNAMALPELFDELARTGLVKRLVELMRDEDLGAGDDACDITALASERAFGDAGKELTVEVRARESGVLAGVAALPMLLEAFAPDAESEVRLADGVEAEAGATVARLSGRATELHALERPMLNLLGRLSGVSTRTRAFVDAVERSSTGRVVQVLDTRKTTPGLRVLEKYAVRCGGGVSHRIGLHDAVLVKDNHIAGVRRSELGEHVRELARAAREERAVRFVEVEVDTLEQFEAILRMGERVVDIVLLDNMSPEELTKAVERRDAIAPGLLLESSGGVTLETIGAIARTGVDRISVGSLTHGATWLDLGVDSV